MPHPADRVPDPGLPTSRPAGSLGVVLPPDLPGDQLLPFAQAADRLGFDELWVVEDCYLRGGIAQTALVLAATTRITVGIGILPAGARNVAFAAMELATLAAAFPGRLLAGVGHGMPGWMRQNGAWPASPVGLLEEYTAALRALLHGERLDLAGRYVQLDGVQLAAPPVVVPPVYAGVRGPRSLELSGRFADGTVLAEPVTPEYLAEAGARVAVGRAGADLTRVAPRHRLVAYNLAAVADDPAAARDQVRPALQWLGEGDWAPHLAPLPGADDLARLRAESPSRAAFAAALPDGWVDRLAVVGDVATCRARLEQLYAAGADSVVLAPTAPDRLAALTSLADLL
jgi:5,10-methylenetetrahydromethanopterin reductase